MGAVKISSGDDRGGRGVEPRPVVVHVLSAKNSRGSIRFGWQQAGCALGKGGVRTLKREGDGASPQGRWRVVRVLMRRDRVRRPMSALPIQAIGSLDGWCDAPSDRNYNRPVCLPYPASAERMWRDDRLYDIVVVLDHNQRPRNRGRGSAIFIHICRPGLLPTEGCIAVQPDAMRRLLRYLKRDGRLMIKP